MKLIPVVDLMQGQVVHARLGERQHYRPIQSPLCASSDPIMVIKALASLYSFDALYIADLDAIQGKSTQVAQIQHIQQHFNHLEILCDAGFSHRQQIAQYPSVMTPVIGTESLSSLYQLESLHLALDGRYILSLDFQQDFLGCQDILHTPEMWPDKIIVMSLRHVGSQLGPDWARLTSCHRLKPDAHWIAAGGVRHRQDLQALEQMGFAAAMLASALHQQGI